MKSSFGAIVLIVVGCVALAQNLGYLDVSLIQLVRTWWPLILIARVRQLLTQVSEFIRGCFKKCHYSKVSCSGSRGFVRFNATKTWVCSLLVADSPALGWEPFKVMR